MNPFGKRSTVWRVTFLLAVLGFVALGSASAAFKFMHEGMTVPEFKGEDLLSGEKVSWKPGSGDAGDSVTLIVFWATWSPRSLELLVDLKSMSTSYGDAGFRVIAVNVDAQNPNPSVLRKVNETVVELDLPFPVVLDEGLKVFYTYGVIAVPSLALMDGKGILRYGPSGYSYTVRDRIVDSTEVLLGLKEAAPESVLARGYRPEPTAARYYNLGLQMAGKRMYDRALGNLVRAAEADSDFGSPHDLMGQIHLTLGRYQEAESEFGLAVELNDTSVSAWTGLGRAIMLQERTDEAVEKLTQAMEIDESYTPAIHYLADCRRLMDDPASARELLAAALELNPRDPEVLASLGRLQRGEGDLAGAIVSFRTAMEQLVTLPIIAADE